MDKAPDDQFTPLTDGVVSGVEDSPELQACTTHVDAITFVPPRLTRA